MDWQERFIDEASPHTRGWTVSGLVGRAVYRGFPAHAGMDPPLRSVSIRAHGLPRTRGDGPRPVDATFGAVRLPRTRGDGPSPASTQALYATGFPAHAGMDPPRLAYKTNRGGLPRTRGDRPARQRDGPQPGRASPHTRGWTPVRR